MSMLPFIFWGGSIVLAIVVYIATAMVIEKSGKQHLGANGHLFSPGEPSNVTKQS